MGAAVQPGLGELVIQNIGVFAAAGGAAIGAVLAALWVVRYRLPAVEKRTGDHESRIKSLEEARAGCHNLVRKAEIYSEDGRPVYVHADVCRRSREECGRGNADDLTKICADTEDLKNRMARMERNSLAFMAAVKEKLKLDFKLPEH